VARCWSSAALVGLILRGVLSDHVYMFTSRYRDLTELLGDGTYRASLKPERVIPNLGGKEVEGLTGLWPCFLVKLG
jgi:hypothetical protein